MTTTPPTKETWNNIIVPNYCHNIMVLCEQCKWTTQEELNEAIMYFHTKYQEQFKLVIEECEKNNPS